jgi:hypothetical protein
MQTSPRPKGFASVGVIFVICVLAAMSASLLVLVGTNQATRTHQLQMEQSFFSAHAAFEYAMTQIEVDGNPNPLPTRYFMKNQFDISRTCNKINVTSTYGSASTTFSISDPGQLCAIDGSATESSNSAPFNGQSIAQGRYIWFNSNFTITGLGLTETNVYLQNSSVLFTANGVNYNIVIPDAIVTYDPLALCVSTTYTMGQWHTTVPLLESSSIFLSGIGFYVPVNLPGSISPVTWTGVIAADQPGLEVKWSWGAAVYTTSLADLTALGVKASDKTTCGLLLSNDKAGTPENVTSYLTNGARSGGGSNYTGGGSGTTGTVVQCLSGC